MFTQARFNLGNSGNDKKSKTLLLLLEDEMERILEALKSQP